MTNNLATIRAALERGLEVLPTYAKTYAQLAEALAALAELERSAAEPRLWLAEPVSGDYAGHFPVVADSPEKVTAYAASFHYAEYRAVPLYAAPPAPAAEIREVAVTDEMCLAVVKALHNLPQWRYHKQYGRDMIDSVRFVLGPTLGLVELKEPTPEECARIARESTVMMATSSTYEHVGRAMFDACRAVLWPKEGL